MQPRLTASLRCSPRLEGRVLWERKGARMVILFPFFLICGIFKWQEYPEYLCQLKIDADVIYHEYLRCEVLIVLTWHNLCNDWSIL